MAQIPGPERAYARREAIRSFDGRTGQKLEEDLKRLEEDAALAAYEAVWREQVVKLPLAEKLADEIVADRARLTAKQGLFDEMVAEPRHMPGFHAYMAGTHARRCLADVLKGVRAKLQHRSDADQRGAAESALAPWRQAIAALELLKD